MNQHRAINIALAMTLAAVLCMSSLLDDPIEATADVLSDAQQQARREMRHELAAARLCRKEHGPGASYTFTADGALVCIPRNQVASNQP